MYVRLNNLTLNLRHTNKAKEAELTHHTIGIIDKMPTTWHSIMTTAEKVELSHAP